MMIVERLEMGYPVVALRCHELIEMSHKYLRAAARRISVQATHIPAGSNDIAALPDYYAKLHTVTATPFIFLHLVDAVWSATNDVEQGLWAIDAIEKILRCALDPVAVAAVTAGVTADADLGPDDTMYEQQIIAGVALFTAGVFDTVLALIDQ
jgi:hypothetical protein